MSGIEIAGILLGALPLIISGLEHWRDVARVGGFWWRVRKEHTACLREVQYHAIIYRRNLKELLLPIADDSPEVTALISDPGGKGWSNKILQDRLEKRLLDSYNLYVEIIGEMNAAAEELREELRLDQKTIQDKLTHHISNNSGERLARNHEQIRRQYWRLQNRDWTTKPFA